LKRVYLVLLLIVLVGNCSSVIRKKPLSIDRLSLHEIRSRVEQNYGKLKSIQGKAHLTVETPQMGFNAISYIAYQHPDSLNINVKAGFGMGVGSIFVDKDSFTVYSAFENKVYRGDIHRFQPRQFMQFDIDAENLIDLITGIPVIPNDNNSAINVDKNKYVITVQDEQFSKKFWIDPKKYVVTDFHLYQNDELMIAQEFRQFSKEQGVFLPKVIRVSHPQGQERVTLFYTDRKTNKKIKQQEFLIKIPQNSKVINL